MYGGAFSGPFQRLTELKITSLTSLTIRRATSDAGLLLRSLFAAIPNQCARAQHRTRLGMEWHHSESEGRQEAQFPPWNCNELSHLPTSLTHLNLATFTLVEPTDFDMATSVASLRHLALSRLKSRLPAEASRCAGIFFALRAAIRVE